MRTYRELHQQAEEAWRAVESPARARRAVGGTTSSPAGGAAPTREGHPHDVTITKESPNYALEYHDE